MKKKITKNRCVGEKIEKFPENCIEPRKHKSENDSYLFVFHIIHFLTNIAVDI